MDEFDVIYNLLQGKGIRRGSKKKRKVRKEGEISQAGQAGGLVPLIFSTPYLLVVERLIPW